MVKISNYVRLFFFIGSFMLFGCGKPVEKQVTTLSYDSIFAIVCDSFEYSGHSYISFRHKFDYYYVKTPCVLHSPDCSCRYNRTFIVIKRGKQ